MFTGSFSKTVYCEEKQVVELRFFSQEGLPTLVEMGEELSITSDRVWQILDRGGINYGIGHVKKFIRRLKIIAFLFKTQEEKRQVLFSS